MIVVRFKVESTPENADEVMAALAAVIGPSRTLPGVISFDVARDLDNPNAFIAVEVFEDREALDRQEAQPEVAAAMAVLGRSLAAAPEATIFHVSSSEPHGD